MILKTPLYSTHYGVAYVGNSLDLLDYLVPDSIDLVMTKQF